MIKKATFLLSAALLIITSYAGAATFTPKFNDYPGPYTGTQTNLSGAIDSWYNTNYGIHFDHMYLYSDSRDTFDGMGIANGWKEENYQADTTGIVYFTDTTDFVTVDWFQVWTHPMTISIFDGAHNLLGSFNPGGMGQGTMTLFGTGIASLELWGVGGYSAISGLTYNYDGLTDGRNVDTNPVVPEPSTLLLLASGFAGIGFFGMRRNKR